MKANKKPFSAAPAVVILMIIAALPTQLLSQSSAVAQWSVQVDKVDPGGVNLAPAFRIAIYENLLDELEPRRSSSSKCSAAVIATPAAFPAS